MKWTKSPRIAMYRLADILGWEVMVVSRGRTWIVTNLPHAKGLTYTSLELLCFMTRVAMSQPDIGGEGMSSKELQDLIRFRPKTIYSSKAGRSFLACDGKIAGTDETTMYTAYFNPEDVS